MSGSSKQDLIVLAPLTNAVSGTERVVSDLIRALHGAGQPVGLVLPSDQALDALATALQPFVTKLARIGSVTGKKQFGRNLLPALRLFRTWRPALVHFHCPNLRWGLDVVLAARLSGVPRLLRTEHNPLMAPPSSVARVLLELGDRAMSSFTYVSQGNRRRFEKVLPYRASRGIVIPNGINPEQFRPGDFSTVRADIRSRFGLPPDCKIAAYVGSIGGRRSLRPIFEAYRLLLADPLLSAAAKRWHILAVGPSTPEEEMLPAQLGISPAVTFAGRQSDVAAILSASDVFVTASAYEGMSIAILEAWAAGLPVLATQVDGISDIIGEQPFRKWMAPQNDIGRFASTWAAIMDGEPELRELQLHASTVVRSNFTTERMVQAYLELYQTLGCDAAVGRDTQVATNKSMLPVERNPLE